MHLDEYQLFDTPKLPMNVEECLKPPTLGHRQKINNTASCVASNVFIGERERHFIDVEGVFLTREGAEAYIATQESENFWGELFCTKWEVQP
jgi:hypothetical protein